MESTTEYKDIQLVIYDLEVDFQFQPLNTSFINSKEVQEPEEELQWLSLPLGGLNETDEDISKYERKSSTVMKRICPYVYQLRMESRKGEQLQVTRPDYLIAFQKRRISREVLNLLA